MNCLYVNNGNIVYYMASVGIVLDPKTNVQQYFGGIGLNKDSGISAIQHNNKITCLAVSHDKKLVATGQLGRYPCIYIWNPNTCLLSKYSSVIRLGEKKYFPIEIFCMAFSIDSKLIAISDNSEENRVYVYTVDDHKEIFKDQSKMGKVKAIGWSRTENTFCTVGKQSVKFWYPLNKEHNQKICEMPSLGMTTDFMCVAFDNSGLCYTGGANGYIYIWNNEGISENQVLAHKGVVYSLNYIEATNKLLSGGADGNVIIHTIPDMEVESEFKFTSGVISIDYLITPERLLVGLSNGSIIEVEIEEDKYYKILMESHSDGYLRAIDVIEENIVTAGEDNKIIVWNYNDKSPLLNGIISSKPGKIKITGAQSGFPDNQRCHALNISKVTGHIALALNDGMLQVRASCFMVDSIVYNTEVSKNKQIADLKYNPAGDKLVVTASDCGIYIYDCNDPNDYNLLKIIYGPENPLVNIDWSTDNGCVRGMTSGYFVHFFDINNKSMISSNAIEWTTKLDWDTGNVKLTWNTVGIYPKGCDGEHIKAVAISNNKALVVTGDAKNNVNIYRNPCRANAKSKVLRGHADTIEAIVFSPDDSKIFTVAGSDRCIMQWTIG